MNILLIISLICNVILSAIAISFYLNKKILFVSFKKNQTDLKEMEINKMATSTSSQVQNINHNDLINETNQIIGKFNEKKDLQKVTENIIGKIATAYEAVQGAFYIKNSESSLQKFRFISGYAFYLPDSKPIEFELGEGLIGQVAKDKNILNIHTGTSDHPPVYSGLGQSIPSYFLICPLVKNDETIGVIELSAFKPFTQVHESSLKSITDALASKIAST